MTLHDDQLFFVEELASAQWRLGAVSVSGGAPRYGKAQAGRAPARLVVASDVFYYDGPTLSVHRVSTDLVRDESIGRDLICSPLAVSTEVYCAQPPGAIVAIPLTGGAPRVVAAPLGGLVVALVATSSEVTWLREAGSGLAVESASF